MMLCKDCAIDTNKIDEYYMVHNSVWNKAHFDFANLNTKKEKGFLCIGCLEKRLGRILNKKDFTSYPINNINFGKKSTRLMSRITNENYDSDNVSICAAT